MYWRTVPAEEGHQYWRIALLPAPVLRRWRPAVSSATDHSGAAVPMDDEHTMFFNLTPRARGVQRATAPGMELHPNTTDWYGRFRLVSDITNDYRIDREWQRMKGGDYTDIAGIHTQDQAVTETMGPIYDRTQEHLGSSDAMVIRTRRRLLDAAHTLSENGTTPPGVDHPEFYRQRSGRSSSPEATSWVEATAELRKAYIPRPELDPALAGRIGGQQPRKPNATASQSFRFEKVRAHPRGIGESAWEIFTKRAQAQEGSPEPVRPGAPFSNCWHERALLRRLQCSRPAAASHQPLRREPRPPADRQLDCNTPRTLRFRDRQRICRARLKVSPPPTSAFQRT